MFLGQEWEYELPNILERVASWEVFKDEIDQKVNTLLEEQDQFKSQIKENINTQQKELRALIVEETEGKYIRLVEENEKPRKELEEKVHRIGKA